MIVFGNVLVINGDHTVQQGRSVIPWQETIFLPSVVLVGCLGKYAYVLGNIFRDIPIQPELAFANGY